MRLSERIELTLDSLRTIPYDHDARGALPVRADALLAALRVLGDDAGPCGGLGADEWEPAVLLGKDGTIEVVFLAGRASLVLRFVCHDVVLFERHQGDGATVVHAQARPPAAAELTAAFTWLLAHGVGTVT